jgi:hypothetical protein
MVSALLEVEDCSESDEQAAFTAASAAIAPSVVALELKFVQAVKAGLLPNCIERG